MMIKWLVFVIFAALVLLLPGLASAQVIAMPPGGGQQRVNVIPPHVPQANVRPPMAVPQAPRGQDPASIAFEATGGQCDFRTNPHSFACTRWTFTNNPVFPLFTIDWMSTLQGEWFTVTFVSPSSENSGPEFYMAKNPRSPTQPMGVRHSSDDTPVGRMWVSGTQITIENWRGQTVTSEAQSFRFLDSFTVQFDMVTGHRNKTLHTFSCRDFNRNNIHHLLCDWWIHNDKTNEWTFKGYFGFLPMDAWNRFVQRGVR